MLASELIMILKRAMKDNGDLAVVIPAIDGWGWEDPTSLCVKPLVEVNSIVCQYEEQTESGPHEHMMCLSSGHEKTG